MPIVYRCELCNRVSEPRQPAFKIVLETRPRSYPRRERVNACYKRFRYGTKFVHTDDPGGTGAERAREATVCAGCATRLAEARARVPARIVVDRKEHLRRVG